MTKFYPKGSISEGTWLSVRNQGFHKHEEKKRARNSLLEDNFLEKMG